MAPFRLLPWLAVLALAAGALAPAQEDIPWEKEIRKFEAQDKLNPPRPGGIVFVGSSSIALWKTLKQDFPNHNVLNRGFGGSQMSDSVRFAKRIVTPYRPQMVVVFAGTNDIAGGKSAETVAADFASFVGVVRSELPRVRIAYIAVSPTPSRWDKVDIGRKANRLIQNYCLAGENLVFADVFTPMLNDQGGPRPELFVEDRLHLNADGYALWRKVVGPLLPWGRRNRTPSPTAGAAPRRTPSTTGGDARVRTWF